MICVATKLVYKSDFSEKPAELYRRAASVDPRICTIAKYWRFHCRSRSRDIQRRDVLSHRLDDVLSHLVVEDEVRDIIQRIVFREPKRIGRRNRLTRIAYTRQARRAAFRKAVAA